MLLIRSTIPFDEVIKRRAFPPLLVFLGGVFFFP